MHFNHQHPPINVFKVLGDATRFQIAILLLKSDLCVGAIANIVNISKPAVSQHLKIMRDAGLVKGEKRGYWTHYSFNRNLLEETAQYLSDLCAVNENRAFKCLRKSNDATNSNSCSEANIDHNKEERRVLPMCESCCEKPQKLKTVPHKCTPEQIKECHGDTNEHPCTNSDEESANKTTDQNKE